MNIHPIFYPFVALGVCILMAVVFLIPFWIALIFTDLGTAGVVQMFSIFGVSVLILLYYMGDMIING